MQLSSGSAPPPADHSPERSAEQSDQYCSMDASKLKAPPVESSAVQSAQYISDADGETITGKVKCAECGQPCGYSHGAVHWVPIFGPTQERRMRVPICGPICLMAHYSNALWSANNGECEDQQTGRWTANLMHEQLSRSMNGTHSTLAEVDCNSDADVGSARTVVHHSAKTSAEQPDHDCESTVTSTTANQQRCFGYSHDEIVLRPREMHAPTPPTPHI